MKNWILLIFIFTCSFSIAQSSVLQLFENSTPGMVNTNSKPRLIGKVGSNFMMMDFSLKGTALTIFDSSFQFIKQKEQLSAFYFSRKNIDKDSLRVSWNEFHTDEEWLCLQTFDQNGVGTSTRIATLENKNHRLVNCVSDKRNRYSFFFTSILQDSSNVNIQGVILDYHWQKIKEVSGSFALNMFLERATLPRIDAAGNIHVFVYDKLSNYRISTTLTVNTLLFGENNFRRESFLFDNSKLYDPIFSDDPNTKQLVMNDFFYNGQTKEKKGIVTIRIPYERGLGLNPVFQEIPDSIKSALRSNTKHLRARQSILESVVTIEIFENNTSTFLLTDLLDLPIHQLVRDVEVEPEYRNQIRSKFRNNKGYTGEPYLYPNSYNSSSSNMGNYVRDIVTPAQTVTSINRRTGETSTRTTPAQTVTYVNPSTYNTGGISSPLSSNSPKKINNPFPIPINEKRVVFFVDDKGNLKWHKYLSEEFSPFTFSLESPISYLMENGTDIQFLHYHLTGKALNKSGKPETGKYAMKFSLITISEMGVYQAIVSAVSDEGNLFYKPMQIANGKYLMPYNNVLLGKSGLALLQTENDKPEK